MTDRMTPAQYRAFIANSSVSKTGRVVAAEKPTVKDSLTARQNKYGAKKVELDGMMFDSKREAHHWNQLKLRRAASQITDLQRQVRYDLHVNGTKVCTYVADFTYREGGALVIADSKGMKTPMYRLKKKMVKAEYGLDIVEL